MKLLLLIALSVPCCAQISFRAGTDFGTNSGAAAFLSASYTSGSGSNRLLVCAAATATGTTLVSATYAGAAMSVTQSNGSLYLLQLLAPATGANTLVITMNITSSIQAGCADYTGVKQTGQPDNTSTANGAAFPAAGSVTATITPVAATTWAILAVGGYSDGTPPVAGTGATRRIYDHAYGTYALFDSATALTAGSPYSMTASYDTGITPGALAAIATFAPTASAAVLTQLGIFAIAP